ncbi:MAG TPA: ABC transporter permease [Anaerolineaceae bacterium]|jgi:ABC-2 type transport system permease protein|nr:ABC transporter permease [Anaerolineaceae bacterium]
MLTDIFILIWKEWKEVFLQRSSGRMGLLSLLIFVGMFGIFFPLQSGVEWLTTPVSMAIAMWMPIFLVLGLVTDAFAGERERHTLETLLASRLSDTAILFGKIGAGVAYGFTFALVTLIVGAITINIAFPAGGFKFYAPALFFGGLAFSLLACLLVASLGVLVSLRSPTARVAYQKLSIVMLVIVLLPTLLLPLLPENTRLSLQLALQNANWNTIILVAALVLIGAVVILIAAARARFQRAKLILD